MALRDDELCEVFIFLLMITLLPRQQGVGEEIPPHDRGAGVGDSRAQAGVGTSSCPLEAPQGETMLKV